MYKISVIMPCFNVEEYIERSFKSILNQTMDLKDIEVIMVDDCSTDNTRNVIKEYDEKYPNFKAIYHKKNSGGCAIPRNSGLDVAKGKYIMFLDPDDEFAVDMCETLYNKIEEENVDIVKCNYEKIFPTFSKLEYSYDETVNEVKIDCKADLPPSEVSVCVGIHKKSFLDEKNIKFGNLKNGEEYLFSLTEYINADLIIYLNNYHGYKYYINGVVSHSMRPTKKNLDAILDSCYLIRDLLENNNRVTLFNHVFSRILTAFFLRLLNYDGNKKEYLEKVKEFEKNLGIVLSMEYLWVNILNKLIIGGHFTLSVWYINILNFIRNGPLLKVYRKSL